MKRCLRCNNTDFIIESEHTYHDIYQCVVCNFLTPIRIEECCKKSFLYVAIDDKNPERRRLHRQCLTCGGCVDRNRPLSFKKYSNEIRYEFSHNNVSEEYIEKWEKRKLDCKMELMKRWTEELQENGIQPKIVFKEPESKHNKKYKLSLLSNEAVIDAVFKN